MKMNGINFCKINCNLRLYTHISRKYPYTVNIYKNFVQAVFERLENKIFMCTNIYFTQLYIYIYTSSELKVLPFVV